MDSSVPIPDDGKPDLEFRISQKRIRRFTFLFSLGIVSGIWICVFPLMAFVFGHVSAYSLGRDALFTLAMLVMTLYGLPRMARKVSLRITPNGLLLLNIPNHRDIPFNALTQIRRTVDSNGRTLNIRLYYNKRHFKIAGFENMDLLFDAIRAKASGTQTTSVHQGTMSWVFDSVLRLSAAVLVVVLLLLVSLAAFFRLVGLDVFFVSLVVVVITGHCVSAFYIDGSLKKKLLSLLLQCGFLLLVVAFWFLYWSPFVR